MDDVNRRKAEHRAGKVRTTKGYGNFQALILEVVGSLGMAREREKYWKSASGRKKSMVMFGRRVMARSSNG